jgi:putative PIN family toxin of toxin-antitoxin system
LIRALLDTNVIVSGIIKGNSPPGRILEALFEQRFVGVSSEYVLEEVTRALAYPRISQKYRVSRERAEAVTASLALLLDLVKPTGLAHRLSRDPKDDPLLACAAQGGADYLVTGDNDLLALKAFRGIRIVSPSAFLGLL